MIFSPNGAVVAKRVLDGSSVMEEFYNAYRIASSTSQWQWHDGAFTDIASFDPPTIVGLDSASTTYDWTGGTGAGSPNFSTALNPWDVPYNTSYQEVSDGDITVEWTSEYPELVLCAFSFQYARESNGLGADALFTMHRLKLQVSIDGVPQSGTGPYAKGEVPADPYMTGSQERSIAQTVVCVAQLPAGQHSVAPVACLGNCTVVFSQFSSSYGVPSSEVFAQIGNRKMIVLRFPKGGWMKAA